ncbi:MAG: SlyX protein [Psychrosphaera sp.]|jgi:SlyX protein|uniref:Protein SlyX homolog n=1 Tax=Psychrosphaera aquimarina TaxID=2044854 RepID=A0ABU3QYU4_9GAMM|nr:MULTISPECIES: SlyX family protein [Psychrosphaera]MDU0112585.1 SlyX family protein [Psychrosphaera aquimarina]
MTDNAIDKLVIRLEELENKLAFQDDTIDQLNEEITTLNLKQAMFKRQIELLAEKVSSNKSSNLADESEETPPPHY